MNGLRLPAGESCFGNGRITRVSIGICAAIGVVSILGYLPRFSTLFVLSLRSFTFPFPKPWVLITSIFYCPSFFSALLSGVLTVMAGMTVEPIIGSREFLRQFLMIGFFTNILVLVFAFLAFVISGNPLLIERPFVTSGAPSTAIVVVLAHSLMPVEVPTPCCTLKLRLFPFYFFCISAVMGLFSKPDGLISTVFATVLAYVYIRYIKRSGGERGDRRFDFRRLVPEWGIGEEALSESGGSTEGMDMVARVPGIDPELLEGDHHDFRYDPENQVRQPSQNSGNPRSAFQGRARTLGHNINH
jgi:membrane associated rhomboid family serine protease